jgi:hypothetical protein
LVRTNQLNFKKGPLNGVSLLRSVVVEGSEGIEALPPLEFGYSSFDPTNERDRIAATGDQTPVASLAKPDFELVDLKSDGLPDFSEMNGSVRYWRNLGGGRFAQPRFTRDAPAGSRWPIR